jgi:hypothetical protein
LARAGGFGVRGAGLRAERPALGWTQRLPQGNP